jgi:tetratricopeptide (TPR) repeat protein
MIREAMLRMSETVDWAQVRDRVTGKWQIPVMFASLAALGIAIATYQSPIDKIPYDQFYDDLPKIIDDGMYTVAIDVAGQLFAVPEKPDHERATVHGLLARAQLLRAKRNDKHSPTIATTAIEHYETAANGGFKLEALDHELAGYAYSWTGDIRSALNHLDASIALSSSPSLDLRWQAATWRVQLAGPDGPRDVDELDGLIKDATARPEVLTWAVEQRVDVLCDLGKCEEALRLLDRVEPDLQDGPWQDWHSYLRAYADYRNGSYREAESRLRHLRGGLEIRDELYARSGWLLGRIVLGAEGPERPQEALSFFNDVMTVTGAPVYAAAAELGAAEANVMLERFDLGIEHYHAAVDRMMRLPASRPLNRSVVESSLTVAAERLQQAGQIESALRFAAEAVRVNAGDTSPRRALLLERQGDLQTAFARFKRRQIEQLRSSDETTTVSEESIQELERDARTLLLAAADSYDEIAALSTSDEDRAASAGWLAAERVDESGDAVRTVEAMKRFMTLRPDSPLAPRALRLKGQALQSLGRYAEAIEDYQDNLRRFARTSDAGSSLIPLARCYIALGSEYTELAEKTLRIILEDSEVFTPLAPEYVDAVFLLGDLLNRTEEFERAIPVLEEALARYPSDSRAARTRFLLGDCYRQSGMALKTELQNAAFTGQRERLSVERNDRLRKAAGLFDAMVSSYESRPPESLSALDDVYLRHARLYQADCYFELGDYKQALVRYERAAWIYKGTTTALAAYVQIVNCYTFMGDVPEAAAALRRAQYLVETMPDDAFEGGLDIETRTDWRQYFEWLGTSELFADGR